jgi:uncharacterized protein with ParB-like and HNH nuclease domain
MMVPEESPIPVRSRYEMPKGKDAIERIASEESDNEVSLKGYDILTYPADFTLEGLVTKWKKNEIKIPSLQRRYIWNQTRASKLIESFLMGLPVPPVFFYLERDTNQLLVVDGHQRLRSIAYFFSGKFGEVKKTKGAPEFSLVGLNDKSPYLGETYTSLKSDNSSAFNKLNNSVMRSFVVKQLEPNDDTSIFQIFERLNTGGVILQGQEIRNCIYEGQFNKSLNVLNRYPAWRSIFGSATEDKRKRDVELILRFFALHYRLKAYQKPMKQFLNDFMRINRRPPIEQLEEYETLFKRTADAVLNHLGPKPFHIRAGLNAAVYDATFTAFAKHLSRIDKGGSLGLRAKFNSLIKSKLFGKYVSSATTDADVVPKRIGLAKRALFG